jgi:hypothetical protein
MATRDALLTATDGFEPSASGNLPSGQQGACEHLANPVVLSDHIIPHDVAAGVMTGSQLGKEFRRLSPIPFIHSALRSNSSSTCPSLEIAVAWR